MRLIKIILFVVSIVLSVILFIDYKKSSKKTYKRPTSEFYVNDNARALLNSTKWYIYIDGEGFYNKSINNENIDKDKRGAQIVLVTYIVEDKPIDNTEIFNTYKVGENDLGLMIFIGFDKVDDDLVFNNIIIEIGPMLSTYLSAIEASSIATNYFFGGGSMIDVDEKAFSLYYHYIEVLSKRIYNEDEAYVYDYYYNLYDYSFDKYTLTKRFESDKVVFTTKQIILLIFVIITFFGSSGTTLLMYALSLIGVASNKGGGGKSDGYYFRRRN